MTVVMDVGLDAEEFTLGTVLGAAHDRRIHLAQLVPVEDQFVPYFWVDNDDLDAFEEAVRGRDEVDRLTRFDERAERVLYNIHWNDVEDDLLRILRDADVLVKEGVGRPDVWRFRLYAAEGAALTSFQAACSEAGLDVSVHGLDKSDGSAYRGLTDKQREVLEIAIREGYFEVPRGITMSEIADRVDVSPQAASHRLRRALDTILDRTLITTDL